VEDMSCGNYLYNEMEMQPEAMQEDEEMDDGSDG